MDEASQSKSEQAKEFLLHRTRAYRRIFLEHGDDTHLVLSDLAKFCRAHESTFHPDPHVAARLDGRREAFLRISQHLNLTNEQLWLLFTTSPMPLTQRRTP
jgi:hypothetical protein